MSSSGSEKFRQAADGTGGAATVADAAEDGTITAAAWWLSGISDDEVHEEPLLQERGEAVATLACLRACSAGSPVNWSREGLKLMWVVAQCRLAQW